MLDTVDDAAQSQDTQNDKQNKKRQKQTKCARSNNNNNTTSFSGWGASTTLTKLHDLAVYIRVSTIHHDQWISIVGRGLGIDNATRWNSWFNVINIAVLKCRYACLLGLLHRRITRRTTRLA